MGAMVSSADDDILAIAMGMRTMAGGIGGGGDVDSRRADPEYPGSVELLGALGVTSDTGRWQGNSLATTGPADPHRSAAGAVLEELRAKLASTEQERDQLRRSNDQAKALIAEVHAELKTTKLRADDQVAELVRSLEQQQEMAQRQKGHTDAEITALRSELASVHALAQEAETERLVVQTKLEMIQRDHALQAGELQHREQRMRLEAAALEHGGTSHRQKLVDVNSALTREQEERTVLERQKRELEEALRCARRGATFRTSALMRVRPSAHSLARTPGPWQEGARG